MDVLEWVDDFLLEASPEMSSLKLRAATLTTKVEYWN